MKKYYREIDSLRAIAVIAVIINHINESLLPGGFLGVDLFFVISGFVVTGSISNISQLSLKDFLFKFYKKRFKRLYPALLACVTLFLFLTPVFIHDRQIFNTGVFSILGVSNMYLLYNSMEYFEPLASLNPFTHTWSLGVEEQFYLLFPFVFFVFRKNKRYRQIAFYSLFAISVFIFLYLYKTDSNYAFYLMPSRFWQFMLGAVIFDSSITSVFRKFNAHLILVPLSLIFFIFYEADQFNPWYTILFSLVSGMILSLIKESSNERGYLVIKPVLLIGTLSYSLYLFHWPILVFYENSGLAIFQKTKIWVVLLIILLLSFISYYLVENYFRSRKWNKINIFLVLSVFTILLLMPFCYKRYSAQVYRGVQKEKYGFYTLDGKSLKSFKEQCHEGSKAPSKFLELSRFYEAYQKCKIVGDISNRNTIYSFGNSHVNEKIPALHQFASSYGFNLFVMIKESLPIWPFEITERQGFTKDASSKIFGNFFSFVNEYGKTGDIIILSTPYYHFYNNSKLRDSKGALVKDDEAVAIFLDYLLDKIIFFDQKGIALYFIEGYPYLKKNIFPVVCYQPGANIRESCKLKNTIDNISNQFRLKVNKILGDRLGENFINLGYYFDRFIIEEAYPLRFYHNSTHLSIYGNRVVYEALLEALIIEVSE